MNTSQTNTKERGPTFFDFAAEVGLTKHIGGLAATEALIQHCPITKDYYFLDVGCGVEATPCFIAKKVGCRVMGVDIKEKMVERSKERAKRKKLANRVEFRVADAQELPFQDDLFNAHVREFVSPASNLVVGSPGSAGVVEGIVQKIERPENGALLQQGEILVTVQTDIAWTLLFPRAAAVITDIGAPLSHAAIVPRELGIPAVVGCGNATILLHTGDLVRVDGGRGIVKKMKDHYD
jgi:phosphohistidine swiveling domain-containing protein